MQPSVAQTGSEADAEFEARIGDFVDRPHPNGVALAAARNLGPQATQTLIRILSDQTQAVRWSVAATALAMIGEPAGVAAVIEFIERPVRPETAEFSPWARSNALLSLGYAVNREGGPLALDYLLDGLSNAVWQKRLSGTEGQGTPISELIEYTVIGLALTGHPRAREAIQRVIDDETMPTELRETAMQALEEFALVEAIGIEAYDRRRWE